MKILTKKRLVLLIFLTLTVLTGFLTTLSQATNIGYKTDTTTITTTQNDSKTISQVRQIKDGYEYLYEEPNSTVNWGGYKTDMEYERGYLNYSYDYNMNWKNPSWSYTNINNSWVVPGVSIQYYGYELKSGSDFGTIDSEYHGKSNVLAILDVDTTDAQYNKTDKLHMGVGSGVAFTFTSNDFSRKFGFQITDEMGTPVAKLRTNLGQFEHDIGAWTAWHNPLTNNNWYRVVIYQDSLSRYSLFLNGTYKGSFNTVNNVEFENVYFFTNAGLTHNVYIDGLYWGSDNYTLFYDGYQPNYSNYKNGLNNTIDKQYIHKVSSIDTSGNTINTSSQYTEFTTDGIGSTLMWLSPKNGTIQNSFPQQLEMVVKTDSEFNFGISEYKTISNEEMNTILNYPGSSNPVWIYVDSLDGTNWNYEYRELSSWSTVHSGATTITCAYTDEGTNFAFEFIESNSTQSFDLLELDSTIEFAPFMDNFTNIYGISNDLYTKFSTVSYIETMDEGVENHETKTYYDGTSFPGITTYLEDFDSDYDENENTTTTTSEFFKRGNRDYLTRCINTTTNQYIKLDNGISGFQEILVKLNTTDTLFEIENTTLGASPGITITRTNTSVHVFTQYLHSGFTAWNQNYDCSKGDVTIRLQINTTSSEIDIFFEEVGLHVNTDYCIGSEPMIGSTTNDLFILVIYPGNIFEDDLRPFEWGYSTWSTTNNITFTPPTVSGYYVYYRYIYDIDLEYTHNTTDLMSRDSQVVAYFQVNTPVDSFNESINNITSGFSSTYNYSDYSNQGYAFSSYHFYYNMNISQYGNPYYGIHNISVVVRANWIMYLKVVEADYFEMIIATIAPFMVFVSLTLVFKDFGKKGSLLGLFLGTIFAFIIMMMTGMLNNLNGIFLLACSGIGFTVMKAKYKDNGLGVGDGND